MIINHGGSACRHGDKPGYEHWSGKPTRPGHHAAFVVTAHTIADGLAIHCECGEWRAFLSDWDLTPAQIRERLEAEHAKHRAEAG